MEKCLSIFNLNQICRLTGANADKRVPLTPSQQKLALAKFMPMLQEHLLNVTLSANIDLR